MLSPLPALAEPGSAAKTGTVHIAVESNADAISAFVSFVMVRLSQKSARTGSKYRNIVEIVVKSKNEFGYQHLNLTITPCGLSKAPAKDTRADILPKLIQHWNDKSLPRSPWGAIGF
jgi:hypothetical protein